MKDNNSKEYMPKIYCLHYRECDPKKCTALKLKKFNLLKIIKKIKGNSIILNPFARTELTIDDRKIIIRSGLTVIDCSWNKLLDLKKFNLGVSRKLPPLLAANPTSYGKWDEDS